MNGLMKKKKKVKKEFQGYYWDGKKSHKLWKEIR